jgi:sulfur carrier protein
MNINVSVNGELVELPAQCTIAQLLSQCGFDSERRAVAVNTEFVPRSRYGEYVLGAGDRVDVLAPVQGG